MKEIFDMQAPTYPTSIKDLIQGSNSCEVKWSYLNEWMQKKKSD